MIVDFDVSLQGREKIAHRLNELLADTYVLYTKTQNFHWNVYGPNFRSLHSLFESQYKELAEAVDTIAERIRALGMPAKGTLDAYLAASRVQEDLKVLPPENMIVRLLEGQNIVTHGIRQVLPLVRQYNDIATEDLLIERVRAHEKIAWQLRSLLEQEPKRDYVSDDIDKLRHPEEQTVLHPH